MVYPKGRYRDTGSQGAPWMQDASRTLNYTYDSMGRIHTMAEPSPGPSWVSGVTYNAASQPTNFSGLGETRTYNILGQLTQITAGSSFSERYDYSATQNNGRITGKKNLLSGEDVRYVYDSLQRLQSAITETDPLVTQWGQNFTYDGWGNLLGASVAKGSAPTFSVTVNGLTNRITGQSYDANGNQAVTGSSYDVENRLKGAGTYPNYYQYTYDGSNKRVAKSVPLTWDDENGTVFGEELLMFYGAGGERLAEFTMSIVKFGTPSQWYLRFTEKKTLVWFGSKLLRDGKYAVIQDRLGSVRWRRDTTNNQTETADYYPYGQEKPSATTNDREKFATYLRDPESGLDYADQRYHNPGWGRFLTADPYQASAGPGDPGSWNRYAYTRGDPTNRIDRTGLYDEVPADTLPEYVQLLLDKLRWLPFSGDEDPGALPPDLPGVPTLLQTSTRWGRQWALEGLHAISENCGNDLNRTLEGSTATIGFFIANTINNMVVLTTWDPDQMNMTMKDLYRGTGFDERTVRQFLSDADVDIDHAAGVYLGTNAIAVTSDAARNNFELRVTLLHEALHIAFDKETHGKLARTVLGKDAGTDIGNSAAVDEWLRGCIRGKRE